MILPYSTNVANVPDTSTVMIDGVVYNVFEHEHLSNVMEAITCENSNPTFEMWSIGGYVQCVCGMTRSSVCCKEAFKYTCKHCHEDSCTSMHDDNTNTDKVIVDLSIHATEDSGVHSNMVSLNMTTKPMCDDVYLL